MTKPATTHTPGPWFRGVIKGTEHTIFTVNDGVIFEDENANGADLALIASAPALLEALEACLEVLHLDSDMEEDFAPEIKLATQAIAQAKGESQ